jgi:hypothetical protein
MYYYLILLAALTAFVTVVYRYRAHIFPHLPNRLRGLKHYTPLATFQEQANAGLSSSAFDIEANIRDGDSRAGLDEQGTREVMEIMARERVKSVHILFSPPLPYSTTALASTKLDSSDTMRS